MGIPGSGKSRVASEHVARGYARLNRDERGGTLRELASALDDGPVVGDAQGRPRQHVPHACDTQPCRRGRGAVTASRLGASGSTLRSRRRRSTSSSGSWNASIGSFPRTSSARPRRRNRGSWLRPRRCARSASSSRPPPTRDSRAWSGGSSRGRRRRVEHEQESFSQPRRDRGPASKQALVDADPTVPYLVYDWNPDGDSLRVDTVADRVRDQVSGPVDSALCPHPAGPPTCWCRPPLPGLLLDFARRHRVDLGRSIHIGSGPASEDARGNVRRPLRRDLSRQVRESSRPRSGARAEVETSANRRSPRALLDSIWLEPTVGEPTANGRPRTKARAGRTVVLETATTHHKRSAPRFATGGQHRALIPPHVANETFACLE